MSNLAMMMGLGSGAGGVAVADVFSTYLYDGNNSTQTITNGIDLAGEGGLLWIKKRSGTASNFLFGSDRDADNKALLSNTTLAYYGTSYSVTHSSTGFNISSTTSGDVNESGHNYTSWTFRKAPKFFDVVTYTGDGTQGRTVSHNLGSAAGFIVVKKTSSTGNWPVYHRGMTSALYGMQLNTTNDQFDADSYWDSTDPTDSVFTLGNNADVNQSGATFVAYLFAHNEDLIQCGSYTGNGSTTGPEIDLGWQPQWVMIKNISTTADWYVLDAERGLNGDAIDDPYLRPNLTSAELSTNILKLTATGFQLNSAGLTGVNRNGDNYIYMAIKAED